MRCLYLGFAAILATAACGDNLDGNQPPVVADLTISGLEDTPVTRTLPATDLDGDELQITLSSPMHGTITNAGLEITYTPAANYHGTDEITATVSDGTATSEAKISIDVASVNDDPVAVADTLTTPQSAVVSTPVATLLANDTDVDGDTLTVTAVDGALHGSVVLSNGNAVFTPTPLFEGAASFTYTVSDGTSTAIGSVSITVSGVNDAPVANDDTGTTAEDTPVTFTAASLIANDSDPDGQTLTVQAVDQPVHGAVVLASGVATFTPDQDYFGPASFRYTLTDGTLTDTALVNITVTPVNDAPIANDDIAATGSNTVLALSFATLLANDTDVDGPTKTISSVSNQMNGTAVIVGTDVVVTPTAGFTGTTTFDYVVTDGTLSDTGSVTVNVTDNNHAPVAVDDAKSIDEDVTTMWPATDFSGNDTDSDGDTLMVQDVTPNANTHGTVVLSAGVVTFDPADDYNGQASFDYTISDGAKTDTGTVTITIAAVDDAPIAVADALTGTEDTAKTILPSELLANDSDPDGTNPTVSAVDMPTNGTVDLTGGVITFTPAQDFFGAASFRYTIKDASNLTASAIVTITLAPVNDPAVAVDDTFAIDEDMDLVITPVMLSGNDTDAESEPLTVMQVLNPAHGTVVMAAGTVTFHPDADYNGPASFDYRVSDGHPGGGDTGTANITVRPVNDAPVAVDDPVTATEDTALDIPIATILANDSDVDLTTPTFVGIGAVTGGTASVIGTDVHFVPALNSTAPATIAYTITDGALMAGASIKVTITPVDDAPTVVGESTAMQNGDSKVFTFVSLLANDSDPDSTISISGVSNATGGTLTSDATSATFTATTVGTGGFDYAVTDGNSTVTGHVTITIAMGPVCGDGVVNGTDVCDDGGTADGNGCDHNCQEEAGFTCDEPGGAPSVCTPICGDSMVKGSELCDNGGDDLDGCTSLCTPARLCNVAQFPGGDRFAVDPATGHCYVSFDDDMQTWAAAEDACSTSGGYLATITSAGEQTIVGTAQNPAQNPWIGATDDGNDTDAIFNWVNGGTTAGFQHFAAGQPDDDAGFGGTGECLHLVDAAGNWNDTNCTIATFVVGRICEMELDSCGDGVVQPTEGDECDDRNHTAGDGCSAICTLEDGCGDGNLDPGEECDDDNLSDADNCSSTCQVLVGCGNGAVEAGEQCDDDNVTGGDGCSATCQFEFLGKYSFTGAAGNEVSLPPDALPDDPGTSLSSITRGLGITPPTSAANAFGAVGYVAATFDPTKYMEITVSPVAGFEFTVLGLELDQQRSSSGPANLTIRTSSDGFVTDVFAASVANGTSHASPRFTVSHQVTPLTIRIYGFGATGATGSYRVDNLQPVGGSTAL